MLLTAAFSYFSFPFSEDIQSHPKGGILKGGGTSKAKSLKESMKLKFLEGWGNSNQNKFYGRGKDIFWNNTMLAEEN